MPQKWAIRLAIQGDLRFLSHHDTMRTIERIAARTELPLHYSQGFNPRPVISLTMPRPVGVAACGDLLVLGLDEPIEADLLLRRLNDEAPRGMRFERATPLSGRKGPTIARAEYELDLPESQIPPVQERLTQLRACTDWPTERMIPSKRNRRTAETYKRIDLRPLVGRIDLEGRTLRFTLVGISGLWARPAELLGLLGLDRQGDLARTVRTHLQCNCAQELN